LRKLFPASFFLARSLSGRDLSLKAGQAGQIDLYGDSFCSGTTIVVNGKTIVVPSSKQLHMESFPLNYLLTGVIYTTC